MSFNFNKTFFQSKQKLTADHMNNIEDACCYFDTVLQKIIPTSEIVSKYTHEYSPIQGYEDYAIYTTPFNFVHHGLEIGAEYLINFDGYFAAAVCVPVPEDVKDLATALAIDASGDRLLQISSNNVNLTILQGNRRSLNFICESLADNKHTISIYKNEALSNKQLLECQHIKENTSIYTTLIPEHTVDPRYFETNHDILLDSCIFHATPCDITRLDSIDSLLEVAQTYYGFHLWRVICDNPIYDIAPGNWKLDSRIQSIPHIAIAFSDSQRLTLGLPESDMQVNGAHWYFLRF